VIAVIATLFQLSTGQSYREPVDFFEKQSRPVLAENCSGVFWSFRPPRRPPLPAPKDGTWPRNPIDLFVLAGLEAAGLEPAPEASRAELIRRLSFDLTGLPPSSEAIEAFVRDDSPGAYERLVDRLLESPYYGERWGQHWLDVVRYAETEGFEYDRDLPGAWRFRDYVIRALNDDKPYDRFVTEQLAGDEIGPGVPELEIAAGFHRLGPVRRNAGNQEVAGSRNEVLTERTDIIGSAFLGLTVGCARCHDHKFDPILQKDYYRLQAFLAATEEHDIPLASPQEIESWKKRTAEATAAIEKIKKAIEKAGSQEVKRLQEDLREALGQLPQPLPAICGIRDGDEVTPIHVLERGNWDKKGEAVGMRPLGVLVPESMPELLPATPHRRTLLARWLTDPEHPLTARVMVNRLWQHHFGLGIVKTANDFGANGDQPSHPELLDYLARELIDGGWRLKRIHRLILLSSAYRQSTSSPAAARAAALDPEDRLLWHFRRRRLEAEEIRDAMLAVSGELSLEAGGRSVIVPVERELVDLLYDPSQWTVTRDRGEHRRRSIYLLAKRNLKLPFMEAFDQPTLQSSSPRRESTTHAPQALELLNGGTANELAAAFAARLVREAGANRALLVERAFLLAAGRPPTKREMELARRFLDEQPLREFALAVFNLNAFLYVN
jgi:hypothetical protein